ncbi:MAG TPA: peptidylprolyl isomerase [Bryobacteraceae bacterium]|nr:peptidylprolyl isomerase [Bryobacteraceae bacterium]
MKTVALSLLFSVFLFGQAQPPAQAPQPVEVKPGTPSVKAPAEPAPAPAAAPAAPVSPDTVVAEVDGKKITAAEMDKIIATFPPNNQQMLRTRPQLLGQVFMLRRLAEDAEKEGLDQKSPYKEELAVTRLQFLARTELDQVNNTTKVSEDEEHKYYTDNPDKFKEVKVKVIYIEFNPHPEKPAPNGKNLPTEAVAKAKIEDLAKQIQGGADFGKLARDNSDDQASAAKDGDFGVIKMDSTYPPPIKTAVLALKQGQLSSVIRQPSGFYLIRAEEVSEQPFNEVFAQVTQAVRQAKFQEWLRDIQKQYSVKVEDQSYFTPRVPAQLQQVR